MTESPNTPEAPRMKPWLRVLLIASLAVNFLIVGIVAGAVLLHDDDDRRRPPRLDSFGGPLTGALEFDDRKAIGKDLRRMYREGGGASREELRKEFDGIVSDLRRVPFDPDAVRERMKHQRDNMSRRLELGQELLLERLTQMSDADRADYADRVQGGLKKLPGGKRGH